MTYLETHRENYPTYNSRAARVPGRVSHVTRTQNHTITKSAPELTSSFQASVLSHAQSLKTVAKDARD